MYLQFDPNGSLPVCVISPRTAAPPEVIIFDLSLSDWGLLVLITVQPHGHKRFVSIQMSIPSSATDIRYGIVWYLIDSLVILCAGIAGGARG